MTRGLRNKNPFNIKYNGFNKWIGLVGSDGVFCKFDTLDHGVRAGLVLLRNYINRGYDTPRKIINRFAPNSENPTSSYLHFIRTFVPLDEVIKYRSDAFVKLSIGICIFESDKTFTKDYIYNIMDRYRV